MSITCVKPALSKTIETKKFGEKKRIDPLIKPQLYGIITA